MIMDWYSRYTEASRDWPSKFIDHTLSTQALLFSDFGYLNGDISDFCLTGVTNKSMNTSGDEAPDPDRDGVF